MNNLNIDVLNQVTEWLKTGCRVFLVTVVQTWGASPRPTGSLLAVNADTRKQIGSVSGGCIESHLIEQLYMFESENNAESMPPFLKRYGDADDALAFELPCGGVLELVIEPLNAHDIHHFSQLLTYLTQNHRVYRVIHYHAQQSGVFRALEIVKSDLSTLHTELANKHVLIHEHKDRRITHRLDPLFKLLVIGAGDVANHLIPLAQTVGFKVTLCDPRTELLERVITDAVRECNIENLLPDDLIRQQFLDAFSCIVCLAHDPRVDDMALMEALANSESFYIGVMGSQKNCQSRLKRLLSLGLDETSISRLHAPIGLNIASKTPPEIAIAIMAELIQKRAEFLKRLS